MFRYDKCFTYTCIAADPNPKLKSPLPFENLWVTPLWHATSGIYEILTLIYELLSHIYEIVSHIYEFLSHTYKLLSHLYKIIS